MTKWYAAWTSGVLASDRSREQRRCSAISRLPFTCAVWSSCTHGMAATTRLPCTVVDALAMAIAVLSASVTDGTSCMPTSSMSQNRSTRLSSLRVSGVVTCKMLPVDEFSAPVGPRHTQPSGRWRPMGSSGSPATFSNTRCAAIVSRPISTSTQLVSTVSRGRLC